jgi:peptidoglycan-N-acetylglucosamine deacetylase
MKAALSLDLDNKWSYMKTHGDAGWERFPTYFDILIPRALEVLKNLGVRITFFVVGQDAALEQNAQALAQLAPAGHEVANHSYHHEPWMHRRTVREIDDELARSEESIAAATGRVPRGFRGPGFVRSDAMTNALAARGYLYDASSLPTFIGPLARAYYFRSARLGNRERTERHDLFGQFTDGFEANRMHIIHSNGRAMYEVPVTTMPGLRLPIHASYVLYMATVSPALAILYFRTAIGLCKALGTRPSILLHPLDFLSGKECPELGFFPGMDLDPGVKRDVLARVLHILTEQYTVVPIDEFVLA